MTVVKRLYLAIQNGQNEAKLMQRLARSLLEPSIYIRRNGSLYRATQFRRTAPSIVSSSLTVDDCVALREGEIINTVPGDTGIFH